MFAQFRSWITTLFLRVPNFGLSPAALAVRTISTTGLPRRQMVTDSPLSTALINFGSLFFAFATLTFMVFIIAIMNSHVKDGSTIKARIDDIFVASSHRHILPAGLLVQAKFDSPRQAHLCPSDLRSGLTLVVA